MATLDWAPPVPARSAGGTPLAGDGSDPAAFLAAPEGELALFRALVHHRLVGPARHWDMVGVLARLGAHPRLEAHHVWSKYRELYDVETLDAVWDEQQEQLLPTPSSSPTPSTSDSRSPAPSSSSRITAAFFPPRDFAFPVPNAGAEAEDSAPVHLAPLHRLAFERGRLPPDTPRESPVPDDAPLRAVSVPLGTATSPRKRAPASPRKRARAGEDEGDESELSELSDAEEAASGDEGDAAVEGDEGSVPGEDEGDQAGASRGASDDGEDAGELDGDDDDESEEDSRGGRRTGDKGAAIRAMPSSKRARSVAASSDASGAMPAKGTRAGAAAAKKKADADSREKGPPRKTKKRR